MDCWCAQECGISKAGGLPALSEAAGAFVHVDLKANLLSDWQEVNGAVSLVVCLSLLLGGFGVALWVDRVSGIWRVTLLPR